MVYVDSYGRVHAQAPFHQKIADMFWGFLNFLWMFIVTLIPALENRALNSGDSRRRGGGGGGGGGDGDRRPPGPPNRRMGRINTLPECSIPGGG